MKKFRLLICLVLGITMTVGLDSCGKESSSDIEPTPVNPTPNNGGGGGGTDKPEDKPIGDGKVNVFEQVVAVQESEITNVKSDTAAHHYTITYNNAAPEIKPGNVVVVRDGDETRIILVTNANVSGNTAELDGPLGDLSYVFYDTKFTITTNRDYQGLSDIPIYYPSKSLQKKSEQSISLLKQTYTKSWKFGPDEDELIEVDLEKPIKWTQPSLFDGLPGQTGNMTPGEQAHLTNKMSGEINLEFGVDFDFDITADFEFSEPVESFWDKVKFLCAGDFKISVGVGGSLELSPKAELTVKDKLSWGIKRKKLFDCPEIFITIPVGVIPVDVYFHAPIYADMDLSLSGEMSLQLPLELKGSFDWTCSYDSKRPEGDKWDIPKPKLDWSCEFKPSFYAKAKIAASLSIYPEFDTYLYTEKLGAPAVAPKAKITVEYAVGAGAGVDFDIKNLSASTKAGIGRMNPTAA